MPQEHHFQAAPWGAAEAAVWAAKFALDAATPHCGWENCLGCVEHYSCEQAQALHALWAEMAPARCRVEPPPPATPEDGT